MCASESSCISIISTDYTVFDSTEILRLLPTCAGHFLPEEDDKFLEKVRAAVEEEERQALAAADTDAAKDAIATAEETRKATQNQKPLSKDPISDQLEDKESKDQKTPNEDEKDSSTVTDKESGQNTSEGHGYGGAYDSLANLPIEFYHYYHGSNTDMGTLIEVCSSTFLQSLDSLLHRTMFFFQAVYMVASNCWQFVYSMTMSGVSLMADAYTSICIQLHFHNNLLLLNLHVQVRRTWDAYIRPGGR